ncbi:M14 family metallopeptidase [Namhaeicola litoreus]|uniref:M14 family metallopeptidase n=1 Tax=Namhaeicola litoreus TaxID=1052145 RepID=A0ABW3Y8N6_9FLAO
MSKYFLAIFLFIGQFCIAQENQTIFEKNGETKTATYHETIDFYRQLSRKYPSISILEFGETDSGFPLHLVLFQKEGKFIQEDHPSKSLITILINNGIHPGEPDGVDASMMLIRDLANGKLNFSGIKDLLVGVIPIYNIGGSLNRNSTSRVNQNGPEEYGFRGNARNFDLNRDFIKADTKNTIAFAEIFHFLNPDIFIDNHVSNGADYQYILTHLFTQHNKLGGISGNFLEQTMRPWIENDLKKKNFPITPYVNVFNRVPDNGFQQFFDSPRYSTGYTTLFNTLGLMVETHMLKPYEQRVWGTYELMVSALHFGIKFKEKIHSIREQKLDLVKNKDYPIQWEIDTTMHRLISFNGYEGNVVQSEITGLDRLQYDRSKPFTKPIKYYDQFIPSKTVKIPLAYIVPKSEWKVLERLKMNQIVMETLQRDTVIQAELYIIEDYKTYDSPYEGHYPHYNTTVKTEKKNIDFSKGDFIITTDQKGIRYLLETLEPEAKDSFFNWNFFDPILQQKEGFSPYVFEDLAIEILEKDPELRERFNQKKLEDPNFSNNSYLQLEFIYNQSKYRESSYLKYPIYRVTD